MLSFRYNYNNVLIYINFYIFRSSLAHKQLVYSCMKQSTSLTFETGPTRIYILLFAYIIYHHSVR